MAASAVSLHREEAVELFNEARTGERTERVQYLVHVQEIVLHKEPALLEEFVPAFLELEVDKTAEVRKTLVAFLDDVIKQFPQYLLQAMPALIRLCDDSSSLVLTRLVLAANSSIFRQGLTLITSAHSPLTDTEKRNLWGLMKDLRAALCAQLRKPKGSVRTPVAKLLETLSLAFLPADLNVIFGGAQPPLLFNASLADAALQAELQKEAQECLTALIDALKPGAVDTVTATVVVRAVTSAVHREACRDRGIRALVTFAQSVLGATLSASQAVSLQKALKQCLAQLLTDKLCESDVSLRQPVRDVLGTLNQLELFKRTSESAKRSAANRDSEPEEGNGAASASADDAAAKRNRKEQLPEVALASYEGAYVDEIGLNPEGDPAQMPNTALLTGMPSFEAVASLGSELLSELVLQILGQATLQINDTSFASTAVFTALLSRLSVLAAPPISVASTPAPAPRAAPVAQAAYRDPRRDPRLRDAAPVDSSTSASAIVPSPSSADAATLVAQQLAAAGQQLFQTVAMPMPAPAPIRRQPMTLIAAAPLVAPEVASLTKRVFERVLAAEDAAKQACKEHERAVLIARLAARRAVDDPLIATLIDHLSSDLLHRLDVALIWLTHEARADPERYSTLCANFVRKVGSVLQPKDRLLIRLCSALPSAPPSLFSTLSTLSAQPDRATVVLSAVRELALLHPTSRVMALDVLLEASMHTNESVRNVAIRVLASQLYMAKRKETPAVTGVKKEETPKEEMERELELDLLCERVSPQASARMEDFAIAALKEAMTTPDLAPAATNADVTMTEAPAGVSEVQRIATTDDAPVKAAASTTGAADTTAAPVPAVSEAEEMARRRVSLYFALASRRAELLVHLLPLYGASSAAAKQVLHRLTPGVIRALGTNFAPLLPLFNEPPPASHPLVLQMMHTATETSLPTPELRAAAQSLYKRTDDARFIIPVLNALSKENCISLLPKLVVLPAATLKAAFTRLLTAVGTHAAPLSAADLLMALHLMQQPSSPKENAALTLKQIAEATSLCFDMKAYFKQEVLAVAVQQLVDTSPLPALLMRTVIITAQRFPSLVSSGFVITMLQNLIRHKVWTDPRLWEGVIKCFKLVGPKSFPVILQIPSEPFADVLQRAPDLRDHLIKFVLSRPQQHVSAKNLKLLGIDMSSESSSRRRTDERRADDR